MVQNKINIASYEDLMKCNFSKFSDYKPTLKNEISEFEHWNFYCNRFNTWYNNYKDTIITNSIPKIIHQIWIGSPLPDKYKKWCNSWKKINPDWKYILWNEDDILSILTAEQKYIYLNSQNYGVKSDYGRYVILEKFGGVYCDTDFECVKPLDEISNSTTFFAGNIFSYRPQVNNAILGVVPHHPLFQLILQTINNPITSNNAMSILESSGPIFLTTLINNNTQCLLPTDIIFPSQFFYPYPNFCLEKHETEIEIHKNYLKPHSFAIHYWEVSWVKKGFIYWIKKIIKICIFYKYWK